MALMSNLVVFLSAGIPIERPGRPVKPMYKETADVIAIREATRAAAAVAVANGELVFGGHPAITPLVTQVGEALDAVDHVVIFQSAYFRKSYPQDVNSFTRIEETPPQATEEASLQEMRDRMLSFRQYSIGIFIGGMEGVEEEWSQFRIRHPHAPAIPIPTTGAAAQRLFAEWSNELEPTLRRDLQVSRAYGSLMHRLILGGL